MKPLRKPIPWWEEYLGLKFDLRFFGRKTWKAYLLYACPSLAMLFAPVQAPQARPQEVQPHVQSQSQHSNVTLENSDTLGAGASSNVSVPLTGMEISAEQGTVFPPKQ
jgi:hypothetical protein